MINMNTEMRRDFQDFSLYCTFIVAIAQIRSYLLFDIDQVTPNMKYFTLYVVTVRKITWLGCVIELKLKLIYKYSVLGE